MDCCCNTHIASCCLCCYSSTGHPVSGDIREIPLKAGDVLVIECGPEFLQNFKNHRAFSLISEVPNSSPMKRSKMWIALALTVAMVLTQVWPVTSQRTSSVMGCIAAIAVRVQHILCTTGLCNLVCLACSLAWLQWHGLHLGCVPLSSLRSARGPTTCCVCNPAVSMFLAFADHRRWHWQGVHPSVACCDAGCWRYAAVQVHVS